MIRIACVLLTIFCLSFAALARENLVTTTIKKTQSTTISKESLDHAQKLRDLAIEKNEAWIILESLTTEVGARLAGSPADARAVAWAKKAFTQFGFDKVYTEPVRFPVWRRRSESAEILEPFPHQLSLTALGGSIGTGTKPVEAQVAEFSTLDALKQAHKKDVQGKIVFIGNRMMRARDGSGYGPAVAARVQGAAIAAQLGAVALLIRSIGTDNDRLPHTGMGVSLAEQLANPTAAARFAKTESSIPIVPTSIPAAALAAPDADLLSRVLERSRSVRIRLQLDVGYEQEEYESANVIGEITGSELPEEYILLGAHLDSWDLGTGAVDDGAGIAITMAAGHLIAKNVPRPKRTIRVVAFANEEQGVYGGNQYGKDHAHEITQHLLAAESDFGAGRIWRIDAAVKPEARPAIEQIQKVLEPIGIALGLPTAHGGPDLTAMRAHGMAVVDLQQDGTNYFDLHHTANDTLDKVDPSDLNQNVAVYAVFAYLAAQAQGNFGSAPIPPDPKK
jgi:carboxypeptidase Q